MSVVSIGRLIIVGTIHVQKSSVENVKRIISETKPSTVAVELCEDRYYLLKTRVETSPMPTFRFGVIPWLLAVLERTAGEKTGVFPGAEMVEAAAAGVRLGAKIEFVDMPIQQIIQRIRSIPFREKSRLVLDSILALITILVGVKVEKNIPDSPDKLVLKFKNRYPNLHRCLVEERNRYIVQRLASILASTAGTIVAVVGLGHLNDLAKELSTVKPPEPYYSVSLKWSIQRFECSI